MPDLPKGVTNPNQLAMDSSLEGVFQYMSSMNAGSCDVVGFPGYPYLAQLAQRTEFRIPCVSLADEMTGKWISVSAQGGADNSDKCQEIEKRLIELGVKEVLNKSIMTDAIFGRSQIYIDMGVSSNGKKNPLLIDESTIKKGSLKGFKVIEPFWTTPNGYDTIDPTSEFFFVPREWLIMGTAVHHTRLMTMISHELPDILKPSYNFGGLSMLQMLEPYVKNWTDTRNNVHDILEHFSHLGLKTNLMAELSGATWDNVYKRLEKYTNQGRNREVFAIDKDTEDFFMLNVPLSTLDALQGQALDFMALPAQMPLVKLFGQTPSGLNASSKEEMDCWYDRVASKQEKLLRPILDKIIKLVQLDLYGKIDESITFRFNPLQQENPMDAAMVRKTNADTGAVLIASGVISADEERERINLDEYSGYDNLGSELAPDIDEIEPEQQNGDE